MKTKFLTALLSILLLLTMTSCGFVSLFLPDDTPDSNKNPDSMIDVNGLGLRYTVNDDGSTCTVTGIGIFNGEHLAIPEIIDGHKVTAIGDYAFERCVDLKSVVIPSGVTSIGDMVFYGCINLTNVSMPDTIEIVGSNLFVYCSELSYQTYDNAIYLGTEENPYLVLIEATGTNAESIEIHEGTKIIAGSAFDYYNTLKNVTIPNSVTSIGKNAFYGCNLKEIAISKNVTSIGDRAFDGNGLIESISVAEGNSVYHSAGNCLIETASKRLIKGCNNSIIPSDGSVTSIGDYAFLGCGSLKRITIPEGVTSIGNNAFQECYNLERVTIPNSIEHMGYYPFSSYDSQNLKWNVYNGMCYLGNEQNPYVALVRVEEKRLGSVVEMSPQTKIIVGYAFSQCENITSVEIPSGVVSIGENAFLRCSGITEITIPESVKKIDKEVFKYCTNLQSITVDPDNPTYHSKDNCVIETASKTLVIGIGNGVIPSDGSVTSIGYGAFSGCELKSIVIPGVVTSIGDSAFLGCRSLTSIEIHKGVKSIGSLAFAYCANNTDIVIPDSVTHIETAAFIGCTYLRRISIPSSVKTIGIEAFVGCNNVESITVDPGNPVYHTKDNCLIETASKTLVAGFHSSVIPDDGSVEMIGDYAFYNQENLTNIIIPLGIKNIGKSAFGECENLEEAALPDGVVTIGPGAFEGCKKLNKLNIPDSVENIGYSAFRKCESLKSISIPKSVLNVDWGMFYDCIGLETVSLQMSASVVEGYMFGSCKNIESITIPEGVKIIEGGAFSYCSSLTSIVLPHSLTTISGYAFSRCTSIKEIYYCGTESEWENVEIEENKELQNTTVYFYSETAPVGEGNYWHYVDGLPVKW